MKWFCSVFGRKPQVRHAQHTATSSSSNNTNETVPYAHSQRHSTATESGVLKGHQRAYHVMLHVAINGNTSQETMQQMKKKCWRSRIYHSCAKAVEWSQRAQGTGRMVWVREQIKIQVHKRTEMKEMPPRPPETMQSLKKKMANTMNAT